jgi:hypothetical protein
VPASSFAES